MSKLIFLKINTLAYILVATVACVSIGCSEDKDQLSLGNLLGLRSNDNVIEVSYDMEMITYFKAEGEIETDQDIIASTPHVEAQSVDFKIDEQGEIYLELNRLEPSKRVELIEKPMANPRLLWQRIVYESGYLTTYDDQNDKIHARFPFRWTSV